jgi:hypothetical protein
LVHIQEVEGSSPPPTTIRQVPNKTLTIEQVLSLLAETPLRIASLTADLPPAQLNTAPARDKWSANNVLAHLRACADIWGNCMITMIGEDRPTLRAVNPRSWINRTNYLNLEFRPSLRAFARQRADLLAVLDPLPRKGWSRVATVTGAGGGPRADGPVLWAVAGWP